MSRPEDILVLLGLENLSNAEELCAMMGHRFRHAQQVQLAEILGTIESTFFLINISSWFAQQVDPMNDVEHYLQDLIRMHHYMAAHDRQYPLRSSHITSLEAPGWDSSTGKTGAKQLMHFYASFADSRDRHLVKKIYQTLGLTRAITYCIVAKTMSFKHQKEFLDLFAEDLPLLREWINWLDMLDHAVDATRERDDNEQDLMHRSDYESAVNFMSQAICEHCMLTWLELLQPLDTSERLALINAIHKFVLVSHTTICLTTTSSPLKKLGKFYQTTGISAAKLLALDVAVQRELPLLLEEFPIIALLTLFAKFNNDTMIHLLVKQGLLCFSKADLLKLLDALAPAEPIAIQVFVTTLFRFGRQKVDFLLLFLTFSSQSQLQFLHLMVSTSSLPFTTNAKSQVEEDEGGEDPNDGRFFLLKLFLYGRLGSPDVVIHKISTLSTNTTQQMMFGIRVYTEEDLVVLAQCLETIELSCLEPFLRLFLALRAEWREILVHVVESMPGEEALPLYDALLDLHSINNSLFNDDKVKVVLEMLQGLDKEDKMLLCREILGNRPKVPIDQDATTSLCQLHAKVLLYLCDCKLSRHKVLRLLRVVRFQDYDRLLCVFRPQKTDEQIALTRLMLSMPRDANCRLLDKLTLWSPQACTALFQLLLMLAKGEYQMLAKMVGSPHVSAEQFEVFVTIAVDMRNQASSRELVIFAADLPVGIRNLFFDMLLDKPVKGVVLRLVNYSTQVPPELLHVLVTLLHQMSWDLRSSFLEQLQALTTVKDVQSLAKVASSFDNKEALRAFVLLITPLHKHIRVHLVTLFLELDTYERTMVLARLVEMPKSIVTAFCTAICDVQCEPISPSFCRVMTLIHPMYHLPLLRLLPRQPLWFFVRLMATYCKADDAKHREQVTKLLDQIATVVCSFTLDDHFIVLQKVINEALDDALSLNDLVAVLVQFPGTTKLLDFLRYVHGFAKYAEIALVFRVLSKYQHPTFIVQMCQLLDLDDAIFALKRLDRMWPQRHMQLDKAMDHFARLFAAGNVQVHDEFCDLIMGFQRLAAAVDEDKVNTSKERIITWNGVNHMLGNESMNGKEDKCHNHDSTMPSSPPAILLHHHVQRTQRGQVFPQERADRKTWRQDLDETCCLLLPSDQQIVLIKERSQEQEEEQDDDCLMLPSIVALTEQPHAIQLNEDTEAPRQVQSIETSPVETLPHIEMPSVQQQPQSRPLACNQPRANSCHDVTLSRSESAPATLELENRSPWSKAKQTRGVAVALANPLDFHVVRNAGANSLQRQRERVYYEKGAPRIRYAKTAAAQAHVLEAQVQRALGKRPPRFHATLSPLSRPDSHTIKQAEEMLAKAAQVREFSPPTFALAAPKCAVAASPHEHKGSINA